MSLLPFTTITKSKLTKWHCKFNYTLFYNIVTLLSFCAYEPTIETIYTIFRQGAYHLSDAYLSQTDSRAHFSLLGKYLFSIVDYFKFVSPVLFFLYISHRPQLNNWRFYGLFLAVILPMLNNIANGQRYYVVMLVYILFFCYLYFREKISWLVKKQLFRFGLVSGFFILFLFIAISISRFGRASNYDEKYGTDYQFIRYLGESMIVFNTETFHISHFLNGRNSFVGFYSYFFHEVRDIQEQNDITGVITNVFSTFIGNFVMDYGLITTSLLIFLTSLMMYYYIKKHYHSLGADSFIIISLYANILLFGTSYFVYQNGFIHMLFAVFVALLFKLSTKNVCIK